MSIGIKPPYLSSFSLDPFTVRRYVGKSIAQAMYIRYHFLLPRPLMRKEVERICPLTFARSAGGELSQPPAPTSMMRRANDLTSAL